MNVWQKHWGQERLVLLIFEQVFSMMLGSSGSKAMLWQPHNGNISAAWSGDGVQKTMKACSAAIHEAGQRMFSTDANLEAQTLGQAVNVGACSVV